jgi:hypothetical protein
LCPEYIGLNVATGAQGDEIGRVIGSIPVFGLKMVNLQVGGAATLLTGVVIPLSDLSSAFIPFGVTAATLPGCGRDRLPNCPKITPSILTIKIIIL